MWTKRCHPFTIVIYMLLIISTEISNIDSFSLCGHRSGRHMRSNFVTSSSTRQTSAAVGGGGTGTSLPMVELATPSETTEASEGIGQAKMPLKIAVAGAGIGGMFLGYTLQSKGFDVTVFEKSAAFSRFGGPIQLASNALSCVKSIDAKLFEQIMEKFTFTGTRKCGIKDGVRNEWYNVFDAITNLAKWFNLPYTGVIDRPDLQEILLDNMEEGRVLNSKPIVKVCFIFVIPRNHKQRSSLF